MVRGRRGPFAVTRKRTLPPAKPVGWLRKNGELFGFEGSSPDGKDINPGCLRGLDFFIGKKPIANAHLHALAPLGNGQSLLEIDVLRRLRNVERAVGEPCHHRREALELGLGQVSRHQLAERNFGHGAQKEED